MLKLLKIGTHGVEQGDTAPVFGDKVNHMAQELYTREGVDPETKELPSARPLSTGGTGATNRQDAAKNILPVATARQTIRFDGANWVAEAEITTITESTDWNTLTTAGTYYAPFVLGDGVNSPPTIWAYGFLKVTRSGNWIMQEANGDDSRKNTRFSVDGGVTWKVWSDESTKADTAEALHTPRKISLINGATGEVTFDGSGDVDIDVTLGSDIVGNFGQAAATTLALRSLGTGLAQAAGVSFYPTFATGTDYSPRRAASIGAGYANGTWGTEFLDIHVGNSNDAEDVPTRRVSIAANGAIELGDGGTAPCRLRVIGNTPGINWNERDVLVENRNQDSAAIAFHAPKHSSAGILKYYGGLGQFEFRDANDGANRPVVALAFNQVSDYRLKTITGNVATSGAFIDALMPCVGTWKDDGAAFVGFVAHELQEVSPSSVIGEKDSIDDKGNPIHQSVAYASSEMMANIVAELQSLRKRVAELEASRAL